MAQDQPQTGEDHTGGQEGSEKLATLPAYGSSAFWLAVEERDGSSMWPLEYLVKYVRMAVALGDGEGRNRIVTVILRRTQTSNEYWARRLCSAARLQMGERGMLMEDLYADLCEALIRALIDPGKFFWEENFQHCLRFERQHVYLAFLRREGWREGRQGGQGESAGHTVQPERVPRARMERLDQAAAYADGDAWVMQVEDERAQQELLAVEHSDLPQLIVRLPQPLQKVVWLIYYERKTEKDTAKVLGITDRTVRNRLREAFRILRQKLEPEEGGATYG